MKIISMVASIAIAFTAIASQNSIALTLQTNHGISYMTGGITIDERQEMLSRRNEFSLFLKVIARSGKYLGDVTVTITNAKGEVVFEGVTDGPWLLVNLMEGSYTIKGVNEGVGQSQKLALGKNAKRNVSMLWNVGDHE